MDMRGGGSRVVIRTACDMQFVGAHGAREAQNIERD